jgi:hypothetical protein
MKNKKSNPLKYTTAAPWSYDPEGQYVFMGPEGDGKQVADVRGWGWIQYLERPVEIQDAVGALIAEAGNAFRQTGKTPAELVEVINRLSYSLRGMLDAYGTICDTQNWDRHHIASYTTGEDLLKKLENFKVTA